MNVAVLFIGLIAPGPLVVDCGTSAEVVLSMASVPGDYAALSTHESGSGPTAQRGVPASPRPASVRARGIGHPPPQRQGAQARLMARRAAEVRAVRNLGRKLGLPSRAHIRGFRYVHTEYRADGSVVVVVEFPERPRATRTTVPAP